MKENWGCCVVCARICHKGHTLSERRHGQFFCDCGFTGFCKTFQESSLSSVSTIESLSPTQSLLKW